MRLGTISTSWVNNTLEYDMTYDEVIDKFLDEYDDDYCHNHHNEMTCFDFFEQWKYGILTPDDGLAHYIVKGIDSGINAFYNPMPLDCDGVVWYNK